MKISTHTSRNGKRKFRLRWIVLRSLLIVIALLSLYQYGLRHLSAGTYSFAQSYEFNISEDQLIKAIQNFEERNPEYKVQGKDMPNGRRDSNDYWYHNYLYCPKEHQVVYFWTRPISKMATEIGLVGIQDYTDISGKWKTINNERTISFADNKNAKRMFKTDILDKLNIPYKDKGDVSLSLWSLF